MANENSGNRENYAQNALEKDVKEKTIFIDTCSILHFAATQFWKNIIPLLEKYNKKIIIPLRCINELEKFVAETDNSDRKSKSITQIKILNQLMNAKLIEVRGEEHDNFADNVFQVVFTKFRMTNRLLLITQDRGLAQDILNLNSLKAVKANPVYVKRINQYGYLSGFNFEENETEQDNKDASGNKPKQPQSKSKTNAGNEKEKNVFRVCTTVTSIPDTVLSTGHIPGEGEIVYTPDGPVKLTGKISAGGEGIIYTTNTLYVAKIYKKEHNKRRKYEKIKLMLSKNIECEGVCFPVAALYSDSECSKFVGYLMPKAKGKELQKSIFIKPLFLKTFPNWKKRDTVQLCITILKKIKYLHSKNIIIGDINPSNILVVSPLEVYFVDTDSFQIEDFPCPVGTINYTAPEIQKKRFESFLRTMGNENFAVATLLFMIMLPGKPPYSQQGGEDPIKNIIEMDFSYPFGDNSNKKTPDGPWRYIWSHLTYDLKEAFYNTFRKGGEHSTEQTRLSAAEWLSIFSYYLKLLDSGKFGEQDKMSEDLFPTRHKKNAKMTYIVCRICHNEAAEQQCKEGICQSCLKKGEVYRCKKCGKELLYTNYQKYIKKSKRHDTCQACYESGQKVMYAARCIDCGKVFNVTHNDYEYFYTPPKRCKSCREARKNSPKTSTTKGSFCFITTAVCDYLGKDDNCIELTTLRDYRDSWLRNQPDGEELIAEYYKSAPVIVSKLEASENYESYCLMLWNDYITPCLKLISEGKFMECKNKYITMVRRMQAEFL